MKKFNAVITKIDFKKAAAVYLIAALIAGMLSVGFLGFIFRNKLSFAFEYRQVSEKVEKNKSGIEAVKPELASLADQSSDIADILVLNNENTIVYSAKNSDFAQSGRLDLAGSTDRENRFLTDKENPDVYFRLVRNDSLLLLKNTIDRDGEVEHGYSDNYFYEANFKVKKVYLLSYIMDKASGDKIYFISDIQPVAGGELYLKAAAALAMLFFMLYWVLIALWVYANALKSRLNAVLWGIITLIANLAGLFIYLIYKQGNQTCYKCGAVQSRENVYCRFCGAEIGTACPDCRSVISDKDRYCKNCGKEITRKQEQNE